jgi:multimeric flavodoxin WrbA
MKILGLSGSPNGKGNTVTLMNQVLNGAKEEGAAIELYSVAGKDIKPCDGCHACGKTGECIIKDDMQSLYLKLLEADGVVFGTPVYFYGMTAQLKAIIDRTIAIGSPGKSMANKVGGVIVTGGSLGLADTLKDLYFYMVTRQMIPANFVAAYPGIEFRQMEKCMKAANDMGHQMVQIVKQNFRYPSLYPRSSFGFGTHTL